MLFIKGNNTYYYLKKRKRCCISSIFSNEQTAYLSSILFSPTKTQSLIVIDTLELSTRTFLGKKNKEKELKSTKDVIIVYNCIIGS